MLLELLTLACVQATSADAHRDWLEARCTVLGIPGLSAAVVRDGAIVLELGVGAAILEPRRAAEAGTRYPIYSVSKIFAGVATLQQVEAGKLALDAPLSELLGDLPAGLGEVTARQALGHATGLRNWGDSAEWKDLGAESQALLDARDVLDLVSGLPRDAKPGERFSYSQTGYVMVGLALETVAGKPYADTLRDGLFAPLGMEGMRFGDLAASDGDASAIYERVNGELRAKSVRFESFVYPAAGVNATVHDLALFAAALQGGKLLKPASITELWRPVLDPDGDGAGYGLGWVVESFDGHRRVGHEGGGAAWFWHFPDERLSVAVLMNLNGARADDLVNELCRRFL